MRRVRAFFPDNRGNVLILTAAFLLPMLALIGSGVDIGRVYVARSRMQQACDAASLAGRWAFSQGQTTDTATAEAQKFFTFNFQQGSFGTAPFTPIVTVTGTTTKVVTVSASTTLRLTIMGLFGFPPMAVATTCTAEQNFVNTDIVLVLDTTGSMADKATSKDTQTKIEGLRAAVLALYDQLAPIQTQLAAANMRMRFSIVPYSSTVNVGKLIYGVDSSYIRNPAPYQKCSNYSSNNGCTGGYQAISVTHSTSNPNWFTSSSWGGCIEERQTTSTITASTSAIPAAAYDLDIDRKPDSDATRWPPYDPSYASYSKLQVACPQPAKRLQAWTRSDLDTYLQALSPDGGTYHDLGMIWGARMISSAGIFADSPSTYNGMPTNRFVIFMTDGLLDTGPTLYSAYGVEQYDKRVTGGWTSKADQDSRHQQRFNLMCSAVKNRGVSIWVVAFASSLDTNLTNCASNSGQASTSANSADLTTKFVQIGKSIGAMRLTQ
ncbi:TadE/TadG family protein [Sphingomonas sp. AP4-R1]|uniref:TadE/TadG family type IV pilus assembly protein n=1 Tax=Sphingomonas sp. AP4-R1 TaxID=2735134 RepID=UPI0014933A4B|nr:TadE/TadG family type IV pilus assembly protein [Sphingomonas sp. AP4-R1]QJU57910.1 TadE/TadG family protein [Sphingomonas sp. AP4-R1]